MNIPSQIRAGDSVQWRDVSSTTNLGAAVTSVDWTLTYWLRFNNASEGASVVGSAYGQGWSFTLPATTTAGFDVGPWYWQAVATKGAEIVTIGAGRTTVLAGLNYSGTPAAYDGKSQARKDLEAVQAAIRALISGGAVQQYTIGNRQVSKYRLQDLIQRESILKNIVVREEAAERMANGLGDPRNLFVRFH